MADSEAVKLGNEIASRTGMLVDRIAVLEQERDSAQKMQGEYAAGLSRLSKERAAMLRTVQMALEAIRPTAPSGAVELLEGLFGPDGSGYTTYAPDGEPAGDARDWVTATWVVGYERAMTRLGSLCRSVEASTGPAIGILRPMGDDGNVALTMLVELRREAERTRRGE